MRPVPTPSVNDRLEGAEPRPQGQAPLPHCCAGMADAGTTTAIGRASESSMNTCARRETLEPFQDAPCHQSIDQRSTSKLDAGASSESPHHAWSAPTLSALGAADHFGRSAPSQTRPVGRCPALGRH